MMNTASFRLFDFLRKGNQFLHCLSNHFFLQARLSFNYNRFIKEHGGQIKVETNEGEYAEFFILLPLS